MIREKIIEAKSIKGISAKDLANKIGVGTSTMSLFLSGKVGMRQQNIEKMFGVLGIVCEIKKKKK